MGWLSGAWNAVKNVVSKPGDSAFGSRVVATPGESKNYDYGGSPEYAQQFRDHLQGNAAGAQNRGAYQLDRSAVNRGMAGFDNAMQGQSRAIRGQNQALGNESQARAQQQQALGMYRDAAMGNAPSVAAAQQQRGLEDASRMGQNLAAGAVGANPLLAANNAAASSADAARRSTTDAAMMRAQEISDARAGFAGLSGQMRQGDLARGDAYLQQGAQMLQRGEGAIGAGQFAFGAEQAQAGLDSEQRGRNDAQQQYYDNLTAQMNRDALSGRVAYGNAATQANMANASNSVQTRGQNQQFASDVFKGVASLAGGGV